MSTLVNDIKYALRTLAKAPGFTAVAVISLALGIGAGTAIFSLVNAILLSTLPVPNPQDLRVIEWSGAEFKDHTFTGRSRNDGPGRAGGDSFSHPVYQALRQQCADQAEVFGYATLTDVTVRGRREAFTAEGAMVSDNFFSGLAVRPLIGRVLGAQDEQPGSPPAAVISYLWWERQFDLDPAVLGQPILLNGNSTTVVGVLPPGLRGVYPGAQTEFYVSMAAQARLMPGWPPTSPTHWWVRLMGRVRPGTSDASLQAALDGVLSRETQTLMKQPKVFMTDGRAGPTFNRDYYRKPLLLLMGIVGVVVFVACANLAGLSLARGAARQHELAVRAAIGAGRWPLMRQALVESLLISAAAAGLGILLAFWGKAALAELLAGSSETLRYDTALDLRVLGFALAAALATAVLSGLLPALRAAGADPLNALKDRVSGGPSRLRTGKVLVAGQMALSLLLLAGAGLYVRTLVNLVRIDPGFTPENLLLLRLNPRAAGYKGQQTTEFFDKVQTSLAAIPGVRSTALTQFALLGGWMSGGGFFTLPGHSFEGQLKPQAHRITVSETFFDTLRIPVRAGRGLLVTDIDGAPKVVVVNETFARRYLPNEDPLGQTLKAGGADWQIVGVCGDAKYTDIKAEVPPTVYFSFRQDSIGSAFFALRTAIPPLAVVTAARRTLAAIDPDVPLAEITTQTQVRDQKIGQERLFASLCTGLALLAVLLSCIGLYGLMAYTVARRTGEIGIRMALGARPQDVARPILGETLLLSFIAVAIGLPAVFLAGRLIRSQLYGVAPHDPLTLAVVVVALMVATVTAAWIPARRAAKIDPMAALRCE